MFQDAGFGGAMSPAQVLARMYSQRIPKRTQPTTRSDKYGFGAAEPLRGSTSSDPIGRLGSFLKTAVASLDPRFIAEQGGKSVEHVTGDIYQLGRSVVTGEDTLSESPSARAYQAAGEGITGAFAAAMPYVDVATAVYPFAKAATPAGALAIERAAGEAVASRNLAEGIANATPSATRPRGMSADLAALMAERTLPERPIISMKPRLGERPTINMGPQLPKPRPYAPGWIEYRPPSWAEETAALKNLDFNVSLTAEEQAKLAAMDQYDSAVTRYNRAVSGTTSLPEPNEIKWNVDYSEVSPLEDVDLTRVFESESEAALVDPIAAEKLLAQREWRMRAGEWFRKNNIALGKFGSTPEEYVRLADQQMLMMAWPDLQNLYIEIMQKRGL